MRRHKSNYGEEMSKVRLAVSRKEGYLGMYKHSEKLGG